MIKVLIIVVLTKCVIAEEPFVIGGLFYEGSEDLAAALNESAELFNFSTAIGTVSRKGLLDAGEKMCSLAENGIISLIDGTSGRVTSHVQAICDLLDIPHVLVEHHDLVQEDWLHINLHPSPEAYNMVLKELVVLKEWTNFTILYEKGYSLIRVSSLLEMADKSMTISVRELSGLDYRDVLINAKENLYTNFIVDCPASKLGQFLKHAQQVGLMADEHSYIFLSLDLFKMELSAYRYGGVNMTGFRLVNLQDQRDFKNFYKLDVEEDTQPLPTKAFLIHDAVKAISEARSKMVDMTTPPSMNCRDFNSWEYGSSLLSFMKTNMIEGITRALRFDDVGRRSDVTMEILELTPAGHQVIGTWDSTEIKMKRQFQPVSDVEESIMKNKTFKVLISTDTAPYAYLRESTHPLEGNDRYEGFAIDLFYMLGNMLGFDCIFEHEPVYGQYKNGERTGMLLKLHTEVCDVISMKKADFAICDFTITSERQEAIDFSMPFMSLGVSILYKKPSKQPPEMFSFMAVFAPEVWYYMVLIQLGLGVVMIIVGRLSHKEWQNPVPCIEEPEELSNQFSFANSVWLIIGSVMQQGSEIAPIALAPRMITSIWWFFTMIMVASYVGTLVAFLTVEKNILPFTNYQELYDHKSITYGAKDPGATLNFLANQTEESTLNKMYKKMKANNWNFDKNEKGVEKAMETTYAFLMESTTIEYFTERYCELMRVGDLLDSKSYGIGMKKGSPYKKPIDDALLKLKEQGELTNLKDLWWKEKRGGGKCGQEAEEENKQLGMKHMTGVFVVLGAGCLCGLAISILDMLWGVFRRTLKYKTTYKYELIKELKFALKFSGDVKPVKRPPKTDDSDEVLAESEAKDELGSLRSAFSGRSTGTHRTCRSSHSRHSSKSLSVAFARRRRYSSSSRSVSPSQQPNDVHRRS